MKFLVDNQLPATLSRCLVKLGYDSAHVLDIGLDAATDKQIWDFAFREDYVIISKDEDFCELQLTQRKRVSVVWVRLGNCRTRYLCGMFERYAENIAERLLSGEILIELID